MRNPFSGIHKYLSTINYTSKPLLRQTSAVVSKQRTENSNPIPNSFIPSPVSCLLSPVSTRKLILHDYLSCLSIVISCC
ncbi:MAG: hypothetical protein EWV40_03770 [Microcystis flos-aquae Mf_WU_F_19750830_S460]|uniref:Uncharacterized protein n=1 Tax=Microcystis flos-aquae Mf_WU_F_19750830_S460 TaxID=2486237 RepID=A0A552M0V3_9CHRO|nr:MAG: hypothetical protein EWV40_03770 [Microcystis flos-aquae Mf_WU_F_19750830_S460]